VLGRDSVGGPTVSSLSENFGLEPLITKSLAIVSDMRIGTRTDKSTLVERLLSISGEDTITVHRKFRQAWDGKLPTRFMILTNVLPSLSDGSGALAGRFVVLILTVTFFGKEDPGLTLKLAAELPGILNWAIDGHKRLTTRRRFVMPKSSEAAVDDIEMLGAPVRAFIRDCCEVGPKFEVGVDKLWSKYQVWAEQEGRKEAGTKAWFGRDLNSAVPGLKIERPRVKDSNGEERRVYTYVGLRFVREPGM
jgi:putative DNA primase/helicase